MADVEEVAVVERAKLRKNDCMDCLSGLKKWLMCSGDCCRGGKTKSECMDCLAGLKKWLMWRGGCCKEVAINGGSTTTDSISY